MKRTISYLVSFCFVALGILAEPEAVLTLPPPDMALSAPLMGALAARESQREFSSEALSVQQISDLMWAAGGITRPDGRRTAGSARNYQSISIYAALEQGIYFYNAVSNRLELVVAGDHRALTGTQSFVTNAPLNILYVCNVGKILVVNPHAHSFYKGVEAGHMGQNVYLYCAATGLHTVIRAAINHGPLEEVMGFSAGEGKEIVLAQTVGKPPPAPKTLIAYFSWSGNTKKVAQEKAKELDADLYEIVPEVAYPSNYESCLKRAGDEIQRRFRPNLKGEIPSLEGYATIIIATPNWWGTIPPPVASYLGKNDLRGKKTEILVTYGSRGIQNCVADAEAIVGFPFSETNSVAGAR